MRKQRAFAGLTDEEIDQIAGWLHQSKYEEVRDRIAKPRPEGFGLLLKSTRALEALWQKKNRVDRINRKLEAGQKLTLSEFNAINAGEKTDLPEQVHDAIIETTYEIVLSGDNTPSKLLSLQRLADFPARAEIRAHKEERDAEMHDHKIDMAQHRQSMDLERLALAKRSFDLREKQASAKRETGNPQSGIRNPQSSFKMWTPEEIATNQPKIEAAIQAHPLLRQIGLPPSADPVAAPSESHIESAANIPDSAISETPESPVPAGQSETSPAFQCRVASQNEIRPSGTVDGPAPAPVLCRHHPLLPRSKSLLCCLRFLLFKILPPQLQPIVAADRLETVRLKRRLTNPNAK